MGLSWHDRFEELRRVIAAVDYHEEALRAAHVADDPVGVMEAEREWNEYRALASRLLREAFDALETARDCTAAELVERLRDIDPASIPVVRVPRSFAWELVIAIALGFAVIGLILKAYI